MFNWKKNLLWWRKIMTWFLCLIPYWPCFSNGYQIYAPDEPLTIHHETCEDWTDTLPIYDSYYNKFLRKDPKQVGTYHYEVRIFNDTREEYLTSNEYMWAGTEIKCDAGSPTTPSTFPESYGRTPAMSADYTLGLGGWLTSGVDKNFRFLSIDLKKFSRLQAVGRNAFENLGHQPAKLSRVTVPDKCNQIEEFAWKNCTFLKEVIFLCPDIIYMSPLAFDGCYDTLEEVKIATSMTESELRDAIAAVKAYAEGDKPLAELNDAERIQLYNDEPLGVGEPHKMNSVADFVATFEEHGFTCSFESGEDGQPNFIVLTKSKLLASNSSKNTPSIDIAEKSNVLEEKLVYSSKDLSLLKENLKVKAPDESELNAEDYDIYLRWVNKETGEFSGWVKYEDKDSLQVNDVGTYKIEYVIQYKGNNPDLKSNPEDLEATEDASGGIHVKINGELC